MDAGGDITSNQGGKRRRLNERAWRDLFKRFDGAGLTVEAFCKGEGLSRSSFNRWRSRLSTQPGVATTAVMRRGPGHQKIAPSFVDLGLLGAASTEAAVGLELRLELGCGLSLTLVRR
jgi:hypothetical protein